MSRLDILSRGDIYHVPPASTLALNLELLEMSVRAEN